MKYSRHIALTLLALIVLQGCGGDQSNGDDTTAPETNRPTPETAPDFETTSDPEETPNNDGFTLHENNRVVSLNIGQEAYNSWIENDDFRYDPSKVKPVMTRIYEKFNDNFDFIFFVLNENIGPDTISYAGLNISGVNNIEGIGKFPRPQTSSTFGSSKKLQSTMQLPALGYIKSGPTLHELMHNWGNNVIDSFYPTFDGKESRSGGHWGFTSVGGQLGGFELSTLQENIDGEANKYHAHYGKRSNFGYNANGGNSLPYSKLELYLMGLLPSSDVPDTIVFKGLSQTREDYFRGNFYATSKEIITINDIIEKYGERKPSYLKSQTEFKLLTIVLTANELSESEWKTVDDDVKWFSDIIETDDRTYLYNFYQATQGQARINAQISAEDLR